MNFKRNFQAVQPGLALTPTRKTKRAKRTRKTALAWGEHVWWTLRLGWHGSHHAHLLWSAVPFGSTSCVIHINNEDDQGGCRTKRNSSAQSLQHELYLLYEENHGHQKLPLTLTRNTCLVTIVVFTSLLGLNSPCTLQTFWRKTEICFHFIKVLYILRYEKQWDITLSLNSILQCKTALFQFTHPWCKLWSFWRKMLSPFVFGSQIVYFINIYLHIFCVGGWGCWAFDSPP